MEIITTYIPIYRLSGVIKAVTAAASIGTAALLIPVVPRALLLRSPKELEQEIEERKQAQKQLESQAQELEELTRLLDLTHDSIIIRTPEDRITFWNQGAVERYGWSKAEAMGQVTHTLLQTVFPEPLPDIQTKMLRHGRWEGELIHTRRDGSQLIVSSRWALQRDNQGNAVALLEINNDITARKQAEQALQQANTELEARVAERTAANAALEAFGYSVSHDLRTPLRNMQSLAQALEEDYGPQLDTGGRDFTRRIIEAGRRMDVLINDLLAYSRLSRTELPLGRVDLSGVLAEAQTSLAAVMQTSQARITMEKSLPAIVAHRPTTVQMVINLLANAVKFVTPGTVAEVHVWAEERGNMVRLWVEDRGIGIAPEHRQRIFNVFERLHGDESYPGTGIGLAIVKKGAERTGGRAGVESELGRGSRFWVEWPRWWRMA
ncbi:MAG TPA: ATP-binding protein, partial [Gemmataceae bacterium]|nr:ATP-binding protein [Gemmataceae bacterium]